MNIDDLLRLNRWGDNKTDNKKIIEALRAKRSGNNHQSCSISDQKLLEAIRQAHVREPTREPYPSKTESNYTITQIIRKTREKERIRGNTVDISDIDEEYQLTVSDNTVHNPFVINSKLVTIIKSHIPDGATQEQKARIIYDWIEGNIDYKDLRKYWGYQSSNEVIQNMAGICGEMAFLYIAMARLVNLKSNYASVNEDWYGKKVNHGCAQVDIGRKVLVDPAYHKYDIKHKQYEILTDIEVVKRFEQWRRR